MSEGKEGKADSRVEWIKENIKASLPNIKKDRLEKSFALEATVDAIHSFLEIRVYWQHGSFSYHTGAKKIWTNGLQYNVPIWAWGFARLRNLFV